MKKFLILYKSTASAMEQMSRTSPEQAKAGVEKWMSWAAKAGPAIVDMGSPLGHGHTVTSNSKAASDDKTGGFSILQAESAQKVAELLNGHPHFMAPGATIEVLEFLPMPGMSPK
jgi:hypothetical protein